MSRFSEPQHPVFQPLNASIGFDWRLGPYDVDALARARAMLAAQGIIARRGPRRAARRRSTRSSTSWRRGRSRSRRTTRTSTWRSSGASDRDRRARSAASCTPPARATTRSRPTWRCSRARTRRPAAAGIRDLMRGARSTPPSATSTGACPATRTCSAPSRSTSPPPARLLLDARARPRALRRRRGGDRRAAARRRRARRRELRHRPRAWSPTSSASPASPQNSIDAVSNRDFVLDYLAAAATCAHAPLAPRRRDRAVVERGVRLRRGLRRVGVGLLDHAAEEEPRRGRAAAREGAAHRRPPRRAPRRHARAPADLQQGHAGGQGAPVRRRRHARAVPRRGDRDDRGRSPSTASGWPPRPPTSCSPRPTSPTCSCAAGMPFRECHGVVAGARQARASTAGARSPSCARGAAPSTRDLLDEEYYRVLAGESWLESKVSEGGTVAARACGAARARPRAARLALRPRARRARVAGRSPRSRAALLRPPGRRRRARPRRLRRRARRRRSGVIVETEAYHDSEPACHALRRPDRRARRRCSGRPGRAYVYRSYGIHALLNAVCEPEGVGAAVLIRALEPLDGHRADARAPRARARRGALLGPGQADAGARRSSSARTARRSPATGPSRSSRGRRRGATSTLVAGPRIGITKAVELPWRFCARGSRHVSRPWPR